MDWQWQIDSDIGQKTDCQLIQVWQVNYNCTEAEQTIAPKAKPDGVGEAAKKRRRKVASLCTPPPLKVFSVRSGNDRFGVYRVCNWPEIELSALIHPEWAAKSWPLCVFSSCVITLGRTVSTLILSWLESVSEISKWPTTGGPSAGNKENTSLFKSCLESGRGGGGGGGFGPCCLQHLDYQWKKEQPVYPRLKKGEVCESSRLVHFYYIMTLVLNFGVVASGVQNNKSHFRQVFFFPSPFIAFKITAIHIKTT